MPARISRFEPGVPGPQPDAREQQVRSGKPMQSRPASADRRSAYHAALKIEKGSGSPLRVLALIAS